MIAQSNKIKKTRANTIVLWSVPFAYLLIILAIDYCTPKTTVIPLLGVLGLMLMAFRLPSRVVIVGSVVYGLVVISIFLNPAYYHWMNHSSPQADNLTAYMRSLTFIAAGAMAVLLSLSLEKLKETNQALNELLDSLPNPLLTSDENGKITFLNKAAEKLIAIGQPPTTLPSYFDLFAPKGLKGHLIADYLGVFKANSSNVSHASLDLEVNNQKAIGYTRLMSSGHTALLVTRIVMDKEEGAERDEPSSSEGARKTAT
ncbi:MAG: PAS domain-containing protein [Verrucomicrobia bacterium]|nr:PAS domain-containing protein [Verrucomicrobiota bacterium]